MKIRLGITRIVFVFKNFVIKIPNFKYSQYHFLQGCVANISERKTTISLKTYKNNLTDKIAPSIFCSFFGLVQVQHKCEQLNDDVSFDKKEFKPLCGTDNKNSNFGIYKGRIVCLDYA